MSIWTKEKTLNLIEKIKSSDVWDIKSKNYKDINKRNDILEEISKSLNCSRKEVDDKWHNIKSQFSREQSKINVSRKSGCGTDDVYIPSWYAFQHLKFLADQYKPQKNRSTDEYNTEISDANEEGCSEKEIPISEDSEADQHISEKLMADDEENKWVPVTPQQPKKRKIKDNTSDMESVVKSMKIVGEGLAQKQRKDEFTIYGEYVVNELRKFKEKSYDLILAEAKQKINTALYEAEVQRIRINQASTYSQTIMSSLSSDDISNSSSPIIIVGAHYFDQNTPHTDE